MFTGHCGRGKQQSTRGLCIFVLKYFISTIFEVFIVNVDQIVDLIESVDEDFMEDKWSFANDQGIVLDSLWANDLPELQKFWKTDEGSEVLEDVEETLSDLSAEFDEDPDGFYADVNNWVLHSASEGSDVTWRVWSLRDLDGHCDFLVYRGVQDHEPFVEVRNLITN